MEKGRIYYLLLLAVVMMGSVAWAPHPGPQTIALQRSEKEILYGGARGGGKTDAGLVWMVEPKYIANPEYRGLVIRRNSDDLSDWIERARVMYRHVGGRIAGNPPVVRFPSGAFIRTGHLKDKTSYEKYQGHEYQKILIEELTQIPREDDYEKLIASSRSTVEGLPAQVFCTANPGGPGHVWVKARWVDVARMKPYYDSKSQVWRIFVPAVMDDNPSLMMKDPTYVAQIEGMKDDKLRRAWRFGDWNTFSGQFFDMWDPNVHVIKPFRLHLRWLRFRGLDWGYTAPAAVPWIAVDFQGNHYQYREYYEAGNVPTEFARRVLGMTGTDENIIATMADPSIWAKNQYGTGKFDEQATTESIYNALERAGLYCKKANNDRVSGWARVKELMYHDANHRPKFYIFDTCVHTIRTIPGLVHDDRNVEDVDTEGEDHMADGIRYVTMHTFQTSKPEKEKSQVDRIIDRLPGGAEYRQEKSSIELGNL